jgi:electron transport complex protein RnfE
MNKANYREILVSGVWLRNTGLVVLLGLCPLLAVSNTVINALGLGLATMMTLMITNLTVSLTRPLLRPEVRIPAYVLIIAAIVTVIELVMKAWTYDLYRTLGIFIPLIVTNCAIIGRAEAFASRNRPLPALTDGLAVGLGFAIALVLLGAVRELIGHGTLFRQAELLLGPWGENLQINLVPGYGNFLLAMLPPGAFIALGCLVAGRNWLDSRRSEKQLQAELVEAGNPVNETG